MKFGIAPGIIAAMLAAPSLAADLPMVSLAPLPPVFSWTGGYVGADIGYGWGAQRDDQSAFYPAPAVPPPVIIPPGSSDHVDTRGVIGGVHAGYDSQFARYVLGVEGDFEGADIEGRARFSYLGGPFAGTYKFRSDWQGSLRLRAGYAVGSWLFYATGGVAFAGATVRVAGIDAGLPASSRDGNAHLGWTAGLGAEYAFTEHWIGRIEARYSDFARQAYQLAGKPVKVRWDQTVAMAGLSYKF